MPGQVNEAKWDEAKKAARKQYPKLKGNRYWAIVQSIYQNMMGHKDKDKDDDDMKKAGKMEKTHTHSHAHSHRAYLEGHPEVYHFEHDHEHEHKHDHSHYDLDKDHDHDEDDEKKGKVLVLKAMPQGGRHPTHSYLRREGTPGDWHYIYEEKGKQEEQVVPKNITNPEGGARTMGEPGAAVQTSTSGSASAPAAGGAKLTLNASHIRDAQPQDLQNSQIVLWTASTEQGVQSMRHVGHYIGTHQSGGTLLSANRQAAAQRLKPDKPVLMAVRVETQALKPIPPAKDIQSSLFPDDGNASQALYSDPINGNSIIAIIRPGEPLWPKGNDSEVSRMSDQADQDSE